MVLRLNPHSEALYSCCRLIFLFLKHLRLISHMPMHPFTGVPLRVIRILGTQEGTLAPMWSTVSFMVKLTVSDI